VEGGGGGGGCAIADRAVWSLLVVFVDELVEQCLELVECGRWWVGGEPALEGLVEALDLATGGGVVGTAVLLRDVECSRNRYGRLCRLTVGW
jgi:hypothetical protein